jgi:hypothetical protein
MELSPTFVPSPFIFFSRLFHLSPHALHISFTPLGPLRHSGVTLVWQIRQQMTPFGGSLAGRPLNALALTSLIAGSVIVEDVDSRCP